MFVALLAACDAPPAFPVPAGPAARVALDVQFAKWTLGRWALDDFEAALSHELAKYNITVVPRQSEPDFVAQINLGLLGYPQAVDTVLVRDGVERRLERVRVPDLQATTLEVAAQPVAAVIARAVWFSERDSRWSRGGSLRRSAETPPGRAG
jgi:hypothetical protein